MEYNWLCQLLGAEHKGDMEVPFGACLFLVLTFPRLLSGLMARNVCTWKYIYLEHCAKLPILSLWGLQQAGNVHSLKDTVPNRRGGFENPAKGQPRRLQEGGAAGGGAEQAGPGARRGWGGAGGAVDVAGRSR